MATANLGEIEDLLTCSVCLNLFDEGTRKPKYLACHHTFCVECIKSIISGKSIACPLCRKLTSLGTNAGVDGLSSNPYVIQMIRCSSSSSSSAANTGLEKKPWCLKCNKAATRFCSTSAAHTVVYLGTASPESITKLMDQQQIGKTQMATIIEKRREAQSYFSQLLAGLKTIEDGVKRVQEENDLHLAQIASLLESTTANQDETFQSFSKRVTDIAKLVKKEAVDVQFIEDLYLKHKNSKISVQFKDDQGRFLPTLPIFDQGFTRRELQDRHDVYSQGPLIVAGQIFLSAVHENPDKFTPQANPPQPTVASIQPSTQNPFEISSWVLKMEISRYGRFIGTVVIQPDPGFDDSLMMELIECCWTPTTFQAEIEKAHPSTFTTLEFKCSEAGFEPTISDPDTFLEDASDIDVNDPLDVGFYTFSHTRDEDGDEIMTDFQLFMLLKPFDEYHMKSSAKFGRIVQGESVITLLSKSRLNDRSGFTVTIQSSMS